MLNKSRFLKRIDLLLLIVLSASCTKEPIRHNTTIEDLPNFTQNKNVSLTDIDKYISKIHGPKTKAYKDVTDIIPYVDKDNDTLMYIVQYTEGWDILSADKRTPAILASSDDGVCNIFDSNLPEYSWMVSTADDIKAIKKASDNELNFSQSEIQFNISVWEDVPSRMIDPNTPIDTIDLSYSGHWELISSIIMSELADEVPHLTHTQWHQGPPYDYYCPARTDTVNENRAVGCAAVAGGQMLYYLNEKKGHPVYAFENIPMSNLRASLWDSNNNSIPQSVLNTAYFLRIVGDYENMVYNNDFSFALPNFVQSMFNYYGYSCSLSTYQDAIIRENLKQRKPVIILSTPLEAFRSSHYFIIDGLREYIDVRYDTYEYVYDNPDVPHHHIQTRIERIEQPNTTIVRQVKMNWGWKSQWTSGSNDGWYTLTGDWIGQDVNYNHQRMIFHDFTRI